MIYCKTQDNKITNRRDTKGDQLLESKMIAKGWLPYVAPDPPEHDEATQYLTAEDVISEDAVTKTYTVNDKSPEQIQTYVAEKKLHFEQVIDKHIDQVAKDKGYGRVGMTPSAACLGYASFPNDYQAEAIAYGQWIASLWPVINQIMTDVQSGTRAIPTEAELIAALPGMVWP